MEENFTDSIPQLSECSFHVRRLYDSPGGETFTGYAPEPQLWYPVLKIQVKDTCNITNNRKDPAGCP